MATPEEEAIKGQKEIEIAHEAYVLALRELGEAIDKNASLEARRNKLRSVISAGTKCFNTVDQSIAQSELLGAHRSEFWANDLASTALNFLEGIPDYWQVIRRQAEKFDLDPNDYAPARNAYWAMQVAVAIYNPDQAQEVRKRFEQDGLPIRGFTHPSKMNTR